MRSRPKSVGLAVVGWGLLCVSALGGGAERTFSMAVVTDPHIGEGHLDYGSPGYDDAASSGEEYGLTKRLRGAVAWINERRGQYDIRFVIVPGDLTDSAERSEFSKAKQILDGLEVAYVPMLGNHDIWPYIRNPDRTWKEADHARGDAVFEEVFKTHFRKLARLLPNWTKAKTPVSNPQTRHEGCLQNYAFGYEGFHFICLDFNTRTHTLALAPGIGPDAELHDFEGGTWRWLTRHLAAGRGARGKRTLLFAHHPMVPVPFGADCFSLSEYGKFRTFVRGNRYDALFYGYFAGHHHKGYDRQDTELQWHLSVTPAVKETKAVRVVEFFADGSIRHKNLFTTGGKPKAKEADRGR